MTTLEEKIAQMQLSLDELRNQNTKEEEEEEEIVKEEEEEIVEEPVYEMTSEPIQPVIESKQTRPVKRVLKKTVLKEEIVQPEKVTVRGRGRPRVKPVTEEPEGEGLFVDYKDFIKKINQEPFMLKYKGTGKRKAQSLLYEMYGDLRVCGFDTFTDHVDYFTELINSAEKVKSTLDEIIVFLNTSRKDIAWPDDYYLSSRKL